jgi:aspartyl/asparaginyl beta-hydroxylase (cupin superfamily)
MTILSVFEKIMARFSLVGDREFFEPYDFPWVFEVEGYLAGMQRELENVLYCKNLPNFRDISPEQGSITTGNGWKTFFFYAYGERCEENCAYCPYTDQALSCIPGMVTAFFSVLEPGMHLPTHRGPYKGVLRYHLAVTAPGYHCGIRVGPETRTWQTGHSLIFDDTYPHEAWNFSHQKRVVLFVDFKRPLPFPLSFLNGIMIRYIRSTDFVQGGVRRLKEWNK